VPVEYRVGLGVLSVIGRQALVEVVVPLHRVELGERDHIAGHQLLRAGEHGNREPFRGLPRPGRLDHGKQPAKIGAPYPLSHGNSRVSAHAASWRLHRSYAFWCTRAQPGLAAKDTPNA
jgi:hypothetical protein